MTNPFAAPIQKGKKALTNIFSAFKDNNVMQSEITKQYSPSVGMGYRVSGGASNPARQVNQYLQKNNLPGQTITNVLAQRREQEPQYQTNKALSIGKPITPQQQRQTSEQALTPVAATFGGMVKAKPYKLNVFAKSAPRAVRPQIPQIDPATLDEMGGFIDYVRSRQPVNLQAEFEATRLAEHYGIPLTKTRAGLAQRFKKILDARMKMGK